jgi:hypothetical protein
MFMLRVVLKALLEHRTPELALRTFGSGYRTKIIPD